MVYAATDHAAVALSAATGAQVWSRTLIGNDHEGIDMAPGYNRGTVYVSTVPINPLVGGYLGGGKGILWALNAQTGTPEWSWDSVQNLWGNPGVNSGGGLWYEPSFDAQGNIYLGIANPGPVFGTHGGKAGILIELDAQTGKLLWQLPVGGHDGHDNDRLLTEHATPTSRGILPAQYCLEPNTYGGLVTQLASNGATTFAAVNDLALPVKPEDLAAVSGALALNEVKLDFHLVRAR